VKGLNANGLTLIELLTSITLLIILASFTWPNLQYLVRKYQSQAAVSTLKKAFIHGRIKAVQLESNITICPIRQNQCINDWSLPIATFTDLNSNQIMDFNEPLHHKAQSNSTAGYWQKKRNKVPFVRFNPRGHAFSSATTFLYCPRSGTLENAKQLIISFQGRIRSQNYLSRKGTPYRRVSPLACSNSSVSDAK
jgi:type IV fimbrial biogenesis protein FimT